MKLVSVTINDGFPIYFPSMFDAEKFLLDVGYTKKSQTRWTRGSASAVVSQQRPF